MKQIYCLLFIFVFCNLSFSVGFEKDEYEIRYVKEDVRINPDYQYQLRNTFSWQSFIETNPNWFVYFNEYQQAKTLYENFDFSNFLFDSESALAVIKYFQKKSR